MKKNYFSTVMALLVLLLAASCGREEIISSGNDQKGDVTCRVHIPVNNSVTRTAPNIPEGYMLRCIMQLVSPEGASIEGQRYIQKVEPGNENVTFTFTAPEGGYRGVMFWADYVKNDINTDNLYTTSDLKAIGYDMEHIAEMFDNDAADAFYGYMLNNSSNTNSIQLQRPFTKLTFQSTDPTYEAYTKVQVTGLPAPTGFNAMTAETSGFETGITSQELTIEGNVWFSTYLFVGSNSGGTLGEDNDIKITLTDDSQTSMRLVMPGEHIKMVLNHDVTAEVTATPDNQSEVTITFPGGMVDPDALAVGDYINRDGSHTRNFDADNAIAIVFALAEGKTDNSSYTESQTVTGYAFALNGIARSKLLNTEDATITGTEALSSILYNGAYGIAPWESFSELFEGQTSGLLTAFATWKDEHPIHATNLSGWYVPTPTQIRDLVGLLYNESGWATNNLAAEAAEVTFPAKNAALYTAYTTGRGEELYFGLQATATNFLTSVLTSDGKVASIQLNEKDKKFGAVAAKNSNPMSIRPVLTVFE